MVNQDQDWNIQELWQCKQDDFLFLAKPAHTKWLHTNPTKLLLECPQVKLVCSKIGVHIHLFAGLLDVLVLPNQGFSMYNPHWLQTLSFKRASAITRLAQLTLNHLLSVIGSSPL